METYAKILLIASPAFLLLVIAEKSYAYFRFGHKVRIFDIVSSLSSGTTNSLKDVLGLSFTIISYKWFLDKFAITTVETTWLVYLIAFVALDFSGYWIHRISHSINFFWNKHAIHHSSEEFDLACALRQSISSFVNIFTFFLIPAAIFGVPAQVIAVVAPLHLFAQFWYHTIYIGKMGFLEKIIVTPSHHRVHHAINAKYLDKNHGQIFIFWDKLFGTFQEELSDEKPVFGITRPAQTWNPIKINFQHLSLLLSDAVRAPNMIDKFTIWFKPTGWRPEGFEEKYPVAKISNPSAFTKYNTNSSGFRLYWTLLQFFMSLSLMMLMYYKIGELSFVGMLTFASFIYMHVYAYSEFMDENPNYYVFELLKNILGIGFCFLVDLWDPLFVFGFNLKIVFISYFVFCSLVIIYKKLNK